MSNNGSRSLNNIRRRIWVLTSRICSRMSCHRRSKRWWVHFILLNILALSSLSGCIFFNFLFPLLLLWFDWDLLHLLLVSLLLSSLHFFLLLLLLNQVHAPFISNPISFPSESLHWISLCFLLSSTAFFNYSGWRSITSLLFHIFKILACFR